MIDVAALLQRAKRRGFEIDLVPSDESGQIDVEAMEGMIGPRTRLIALTHVPTQGGLVNPAEAVGRVARKHDLIYMLDACQSVGQIELDVNKIGCDILSGTGRKFLRGPRGTGFLYVAAGIIDRIEPPFIDLRDALSQLKGVTVQDLGRKKCGIVTFQKHGESASKLATRLLEKEINVSVTDVFSARIDFTERGLDELVRASLHYFNTENEIDRFVDAVKA